MLIVEAVYDKAIAALERAGGYMASGAEKEKIQAALWPDGKSSRTLIARDADVLRAAAGFRRRQKRRNSYGVRDRRRPGLSVLDEKLSLVLTVYRAKDFDDAAKRAREILDHQGRGHSLGLHTKDMTRGRNWPKTPTWCAC